jgi:uncharacterized protein (TIGR03437 family)
MRLVFLTIVAASAAWSFSAGPGPFRAGVPGDPAPGGIPSCFACHRNSAGAQAPSTDPRGFVRVLASPYRPGVRQMVRVTLNHPEASRWGFQLTARRASDSTMQAGTFTPTAAIRVICSDNVSGVGNPGQGKPEAGCGALTEFATHNATSNFPGTPGPRTWEVEWTPPATDVGEVVFYVDGNAANGGNTNAGDNIYLGTKIVGNAAGCAELTARPMIRAVGNGATFGPELAMNSLISIVGTGLYGATARNLQSGDLQGDGRDLRFPTQLNCVAVDIGGERVPLTFASAGQINAQMPTGAAGRVPVTVIVNPGASELRSEPMMVTVNPTAPGLFTFNGTAVAAASTMDGALITGSRNARPGELIALFATGLGASNPVWQAGEIPGAVAPVAGITVRLGANILPMADIQYAGLAPGAISGLYQINVRIPAGTAAGTTPVRITVGGVTSPEGTTISVGQ